MVKSYDFAFYGLWVMTDLWLILAAAILPIAPQFSFNVSILRN